MKYFIAKLIEFGAICTVAIILIKMGYGCETWQYWVILVLMVVRSQARKTKGTWNDGNGTYSINHYDLLDAVAIYFSRFERYSVHHILLSNHVLIWHVVFLLYWSPHSNNFLIGGNYYG